MFILNELNAAVGVVWFTRLVQLAPIAVCKHGGVDETPIWGVFKLWPYTPRVFAEHSQPLRRARTPKVGSLLHPIFNSVMFSLTLSLKDESSRRWKYTFLPFCDESMVSLVYVLY